MVEVKDKDENLTREPEMIRARELLTDSGFIFVQMWKIAARCIRVLRVINLELTVKSDHLNT